MIRAAAVALVLIAVANKAFGWTATTPALTRRDVFSSIAASTLLLPSGAALADVVEETDRITTRMGGLLVRFLNHHLLLLPY